MQNPEQVLEVDMTNGQADRRHDDIRYEGFDDGPKGRTDNDTHRHIDGVALDRKLPEFFQKAFHISLCHAL